MGRHDWYRSQDWNPEIEARFFGRLKRARDKAQYLRIQASTLAESHPHAALMLLEHYFATGDSFDRAQAHVDQAGAYVALGDIEKALRAYELALAHEHEYPNVLTQAYLELPLLIASTDRCHMCGRALEILGQNRARPLLQMERFKWHAANALIHAAMGDRDAASVHARAALDDAAVEKSAFRYHPFVGLVGPKHVGLRERLAELVCDADTSGIGARHLQ